MADLHTRTEPGLHSNRTRERTSGQNLAARFTNVILGAWLFVSAFLWAHTGASQSNSWILGILIVAFALLAIAFPPARFLNTAAAVWLFVSTLFIDHFYAATAWHNAILAIIVFAVSLIPSRESRTNRSAIGRRRATV